MGILLDRAEPGHPTTHSTETDLIMKPSSCFPGTISPKIELLASIDIIDTCRSCKSHVFRTLRRPVSREFGNDSKPQKTKSVEIRRLHQRPVCHSRLNSKLVKLNMQKAVINYMVWIKMMDFWSRNPNYWKTHFEPALHRDEYAFNARFCDKCVERLPPSMEISTHNLPECNVPR